MEKGYISDFNFCLVGKIKGLSLSSKTASKRIHKAKSDLELYQWQYRKRIVGADARHHLLAYAYLKNIPYQALEKKCRPDNKPDVEKIFRIVASHVYFYQIRNEQFSEEKVTAWLNGGV